MLKIGRAKVGMEYLEFEFNTANRGTEIGAMKCRGEDAAGGSPDVPGLGDANGWRRGAERDVLQDQRQLLTIRPGRRFGNDQLVAGVDPFYFSFRFGEGAPRLVDHRLAGLDFASGVDRQFEDVFGEFERCVIGPLGRFVREWQSGSFGDNAIDATKVVLADAAIEHRADEREEGQDEGRDHDQGEEERHVLDRVGTGWWQGR